MKCATFNDHIKPHTILFETNLSIFKSQLSLEEFKEIKIIFIFVTVFFHEIIFINLFPSWIFNFKYEMKSETKIWYFLWSAAFFEISLNAIQCHLFGDSKLWFFIFSDWYLWLFCDVCDDCYADVEFWYRRVLKSSGFWNFWNL